MNDVELPLVRVLREMEKAGLEARHRAPGGDLHARQGRGRCARARDLRAVRARSSRSARRKQLEEVLFGKLGLTRKRRGKTGYSTDARVLQAIRDEHPVIPKIERWRELNQLAQTYLDALPALIAGDGRIHTTFNQTAATTGRLSSNNPNLQNIPIRTELGPRDPRLLRRRARQSAGIGGLFAGRAAAAGAHRRRGRAQGDLPKRRGCAHRDGLSCVWGDTGQDRSGHAIEGEDDQLRNRLRAVGLGHGRPARHSPGGGRRVHPALPGGVPGGRAMDRGDDRAGDRERLRLDAVRPPPAGARAARAPLGDAQAGRAVRGQHGDPGHRRRHHEGGDGPLRRRAHARRACGRGWFCRSTTSCCSKARPRRPSG